MAFSNEQSVELTKIQKNNKGDYVVIQKVTNSKSGSISVDMRMYYTDEQGEVLPTKKGVRFNSENLLDIMKALTEVLEMDEKEELVDFLNEVLKDEDDDCEDDYEDEGDM